MNEWINACGDIFRRGFFARYVFYSGFFSFSDWICHCLGRFKALSASFGWTIFTYRYGIVFKDSGFFFFLRRSIAVTIILSLLLLLLLFQFYFCASLTIPHFWMSAFFHYHLKYKWFDCSRYFNLISAFVPFPNICVLICIRSACNTTCIQVKRIYLDSQYILETWQRTVKHFMLYVYW